MWTLNAEMKEKVIIWAFNNVLILDTFILFKNKVQYMAFCSGILLGLRDKSQIQERVWWPKILKQD